MLPRLKSPMSVRKEDLSLSAHLPLYSLCTCMCQEPGLWEDRETFDLDKEKGK